MKEELAVTIITYFNPRSLAGATMYRRYNSNGRAYFNPRSLAGATLSPAAFKSLTSFQSTLPRGSDYMENFQRCKQAISIHAPSRERQLRAYNGQPIAEFQSTLPRGSDVVHT